jgi:hypothetical protein
MATIAATTNTVTTAPVQFMLYFFFSQFTFLFPCNLKRRLRPSHLHLVLYKYLPTLLNFITVVQFNKWENVLEAIKTQLSTFHFPSCAQRHQIY